MTDSDRTILLATHNRGKVVEVRAFLEPEGFRVLGPDERTFGEPEETGITFAENALLKARAAAAETGEPALSDDSGLSVTALNGDPGVYSARWAGPGKDFGAAMERVLRELNGKADRSAAFVCVLALANPDGTVFTVEGRVTGTIADTIRGDAGFGYDPIFLPDGGDGRTFGEMTLAEKQSYSHRTKALKALIQALGKPRA